MHCFIPMDFYSRLSNCRNAMWRICISRLSVFFFTHPVEVNHVSIVGRGLWLQNNCSCKFVTWNKNENPTFCFVIGRFAVVLIKTTLELFQLTVVIEFSQRVPHNNVLAARVTFCWNGRPRACWDRLINVWSLLSLAKAKRFSLSSQFGNLLSIIMQCNVTSCVICIQGRTWKEFMGGCWPLWIDFIQKRFCEGIMLQTHTYICILIVDALYFHAHCFPQFLLLRRWHS